MSLHHLEHSEHGDHSGHDMPGMDMPKCTMNMLWNHQVADTCVVFRSWHISGWVGMAVSCLAIVAISVGYASLLARTRAYDRALTAELAAQPRPTTQGYSSVATEEGGKIGFLPVPHRSRLVRAGLYAASVAISYFLMLVAMTYNTYLCASIVIGAGVGHFMYEGEIDLNQVIGGTGARGLACH